MEFEVKFAEQARQGGNPRAGGPPYQIRGRDLDKNFKKASPVTEDGGNNQPYKVESEIDGWRLKGQSLFWVCENGKPVLYRVFASREPTTGGGLA